MPFGAYISKNIPRAGDAFLILFPLLIGVYHALHSHGGLITGGDTPSYLYFHPSRPVGYPLFLAIVHGLAPHYRALVLVQSLVLGASIAALGVAFLRTTNSLSIAVVVELLILISKPYWENASAVMSEALSAAVLNLFCAVAILHIRSRGRWIVFAYALLTLAGITIRPINLVLAPVAILIVVLLSEGDVMARLRRSAVPAMIIIAGLVVGDLATPLAQRVVHGPVHTGSPLARGLFQKSLFHDWPSAPVAGVDAGDVALIDQATRPINAYLRTAPADMRPYLERGYSTYLRFKVLLPELAQRHGVSDPWDIDGLLMRYSKARILQRPVDYLTELVEEDLRLLSYQGYDDKTFQSRLAAFLKSRPPVSLPPVPNASAWAQAEQRADADLGATLVHADDTLGVEKNVQPIPPRSTVQIIVGRTYYSGAALLGLIAPILLFFPSLRGPAWRPLAVLAGFGVLLHATCVLTVVSEVGLFRYIVPMSGAIASMYGLAAMLVLAYLRERGVQFDLGWSGGLGQGVKGLMAARSRPDPE